MRESANVCWLPTEEDMMDDSLICPTCKCPVEEGECYCTLPDEQKFTDLQLEQFTAQTMLRVTALLTEIHLLARDK